MDFNTIKVTFPHDQEGKFAGRLTHYAEFIETQTERTLPHDEDFLGLFINLGKALEYRLADNTDTIHAIGRYQYNLIYVPRHGCTLIQDHGFYSWLTIHYPLGYFEQLAEKVTAIREFLKDFDPKVSRAINSTHQPAPYEIKDVVQDMIRNTLRGEARLTYLQIKSLSMLLACIEDCDYAEEAISLNDIEKVRWAYGYIIKNLQYTHPASELAGKVNLSDRKFKHVFEKVHGKKVHQALMEERMNKAKSLLRDTTTPVKDIASMIGYSSSSAFLDAFKRETGFYPRDYRNAEGGEE
jgi:AraC-like DNA-binding protein